MGSEDRHPAPTGHVVAVTYGGKEELYDVGVPSASEAELAVGKFLQASDLLSINAIGACRPPRLCNSDCIPAVYFEDLSNFAGAVGLPSSECGVCWRRIDHPIGITRGSGERSPLGERWAQRRQNPLRRLQAGGAV